ncbi:uncharacterized protein EI90DRAFT_855788 [Cantharellus anzutake]|uniref:uncharacterized protein n=1 Tax=Cantharellus anzutake TaxID=1750568 RepID=UPI0019070A3E|nr:uncharacterized protein EI90DRAFT_855788 [Cantharellus anzutake]KAF8332403.1 hypothetical protein EI90DRAFT_855788 [Cantharellus anzutake]
MMAILQFLGFVVPLIGLITTAILLRRFASFIHVYFLHRSAIQRYALDDDTFAVVTGATGGMGKAIAEDLYDRGFNLVIHGRSQEKLDRVKEELLQRGPLKKIVHTLRINAEDTSTYDFSSLKGLKITAVFLVAGGASVQTVPYDQVSSEYANGVIRLNALFPIDLLRALLPQMRAAKVPMLVVGIGSITGRYPAPFLSIYSASKSFLLRLIHGLSIDESFHDPSADTTFHYMNVGEVISPGSFTKEPNLFCPTPETIARAIIRVVGCGHREVIPVAAKIMGKHMNLGEGKNKNE